MLLHAVFVALAAIGGADPPTPPVLALVTAPWAEHSELVALGVGDTAASVHGRFVHQPGAAVRGAMVHGTGAVLAIADTAARRDLSFAASLFVLEPGRPARRLCDEVLHASRPLVGDGRVFVVRGVAGPEPSFTPGAALEQRADFLRVDEVDLQTGVTTTRHSFTGQLLHLAGWHAGALLVYRIDGAAADLVAIDGESVRTVLADLPPLARDFSLDPTRGELVFLDRDEADPHTWHALQLELATGALRSLVAADGVRVGPFASPGAVHVVGPGGALARVRGRGPAPRSPCAELSGPAVGCADVLQLASRDGRWTAGLHHRPGARPRPFVLETTSGRATLLTGPPGAWVDLVGLPEVTP